MSDLIQRVRDAYDSPEDLLEALDVSFTELIEILDEAGYLTEQTLPFIFLKLLEESDEYYE